MVNDIRRRLRDASQADHQKLEGRLDIFSKVRTLEGRRGLAQGFYALHAGAEVQLAPLIADLPGLDFEARRRTPILRRDLATLEAATPPAADCRPFADAASALGMLYVLEGSTLGARVIRRELQARGEDMAGLGFLDPYGDEVGERWRACVAVLEREAAAPRDAEAMIAGAVDGFRHVQQVLCGAEALAS